MLVKLALTERYQYSGRFMPNGYSRL